MKFSKLRFFIALFLLSGVVSNAQETNVDTIPIPEDEFDKIILIDHQNLKYEWYFGRIYEIVKTDSVYELYQIEQYNHPYLFGEKSNPDLVTDYGQMQLTDTLNFAKMQHVDSMKISVDDLMEKFNAQNRRRHKWYVKNVRIKNTRERVLIREVSYDEIQQLKVAMNAKHESDGTGNNFNSAIGIDSTWVANNADSLFARYNTYKGGKKAKARCVECIKDKLYNYTFYKGGEPDNYPYCGIQVIKGQDTLAISTSIVNTYMLPWRITEKYKSYNVNISLLFGNLLPDQEFSNKYRLVGEKAHEAYEETLTKAIIDRYCKKNEKKLKKK